VKVAWRLAEPPLPAVAVAASGSVANVLSEAADRETMTVTALSDWSVVEGPELPWVDGAIYLGELPGAPDVLVPVHRLPGVDPDLLRRAARSVLSGQRAKRTAVIPHSDGVAVLALGTRP
jgi:hypothetical protein